MGRELQPRVSVAELEDFRETEAARRLARLDADTSVVLRLSAEGFDGKAWREVSYALVEYGYTVMRAWVVTGAAFTKCQEKGLAIESRVLPMARDEALAVAEDTVADALINFRDQVLQKGKWNPSGGASLTTFFIGNCLLRFPNVYRRWEREQNKARMRVPLDGFSGASLHRYHSAQVDPATEVASDEAVRLMLSALSPRERPVVELRAAGWGVAEIAEALELSYKQVESLLYRARQKIRTER